MASTASATARTRDPAPFLWAVAGTAWAASLATVLLGGAKAGAHDWVIEHSAWPWSVRIVAFLGVWLVMIGAMMMPTTIPIARLFAAVSARQPRPALARAAFYTAYTGVWSAFALIALVGDTRVHWSVDHWPWLAAHTPVILASALLVAGAYEFSPLKDACLRACRTPMATMALYYRRGAAGGWRVGIAHAVSCLGCCWALMLVMFATGVGSLLWMLGLAAVMLMEKTSRVGRRLTRPVGAVLLTAGMGLLAVGLA
jgi:predicted metal-binding membrane protein